MCHDVISPENVLFSEKKPSRLYAFPYRKCPEQVRRQRQKAHLWRPGPEGWHGNEWAQVGERV